MSHKRDILPPVAPSTKAAVQKYQAVQQLCPTKELMDYLMDNFSLSTHDASVHAEALIECIADTQPRSE